MTVYVLQRVRKRNHKTNEYEFKHDLSGAEAYGEIVELLSPTATPHSPGLIAELHRGLVTYDPERDWIVCLGSPVLIAYAVAIAADNTQRGRVKLLQWSGADKCYHPFEAHLFPDCPEGQDEEQG